MVVISGILIFIAVSSAILGVALWLSEEDFGAVFMLVGLILGIVGGAIRDSEYRSSPVGVEQTRNEKLKLEIKDRLENQEAYKNRKVYLRKLKEENKKLEESLKRL